MRLVQDFRDNGVRPFGYEIRDEAKMINEVLSPSHCGYEIWLSIASIDLQDQQGKSSFRLKDGARDTHFACLEQVRTCYASSRLMSVTYYHDVQFGNCNSSEFFMAAYLAALSRLLLLPLVSELLQLKSRVQTRSNTNFDNAIKERSQRKELKNASQVRT